MKATAWPANASQKALDQCLCHGNWNSQRPTGKGFAIFPAVFCLPKGMSQAYRVLQVQHWDGPGNALNKSAVAWRPPLTGERKRQMGTRFVNARAAKIALIAIAGS